MIMTESIGAVRRRQYCVLCGQQMFEFYRSPDGHFGFVDDVKAETSARGLHVRCATCGACYRLLDRVDASGQPVAKL
jgi:hypothetical protein